MALGRGSTLTGLCGLALIGSALYLDLDRQSIFRQRARIRRAAAPRRRTRLRASTPARATGWCAPSTSSRPSRFQVTMPIKIGDKEVVKARPYTLLSTTLTTTPTNSPTPCRRSIR